MFRPIAVEYTSRYSTGRPSRENALAFGAPPTAARAGSERSVAATASRRRSRFGAEFTTDGLGICCSTVRSHVYAVWNGGVDIAVAPTWLRRYPTSQKSRPANKS